MLKDDVLECIVALPGQLFYSTQIPACLWFLNRNKKNGDPQGLTNRQGELLFIDARNLGLMVDRTHKELAGEDIATIASTYHAWRGEPGSTAYEDIPGFCASVPLVQIAEHHFVLSPGRYVGTEEAEEDDEPLNEKIARLKLELIGIFEDSRKLEQTIRDRLVGLGHED